MKTARALADARRGSEKKSIQKCPKKALKRVLNVLKALSYKIFEKCRIFPRKVIEGCKSTSKIRYFPSQILSYDCCNSTRSRMVEPVSLQTVLTYLTLISKPVGVFYHIMTLNKTRKNQQLILENR